MKTPRELLLNRHRKLEPALDDLRVEMVQSLASPPHGTARETDRCSDGRWRLLWQELFVECRRYWMGLGVAWCVIVAFAVLEGAGNSGQKTVASGPAQPVIQAMRERQALRRELLGLDLVQQIRPEPRDSMPGPRSEVAVGFVNV